MFILITRPFVEWTSRFLAGVIFTSTIQFAYQKTNNQNLLYLKWTCYLPLLAFVGAFVDSNCKFSALPIISGEKIIRRLEARALRAVQKVKVGFAKQARKREEP